MNGNDTELDKIASCNVQSSLYSLSHFNTLKVMSLLAILRADVALLDYVRHWRSCISGRQSPVLALICFCCWLYYFLPLNLDIKNLYNEALGIKNETLSFSSSKIYKKKPRCNKTLWRTYFARPFRGSTTYLQL